MRKRLIRQLKKLKHLRLHAQHKQDIRGNLLVFMKEHPVRSDVAARQLTQKALPSLIASLLNSLKIIPMPIAVILLSVMVGAGTLFAAESSIPGDILYPVKVRVTETLRAKLTTDAEARADWEIERAGRRAMEAEELTAEGELNVEARARVEEQIDAHLETAHSVAEELEAKGNTNASERVESNIEQYLEAKATVLENLGIDLDEEIESDVEAEADAEASSEVEASAEEANEKDGDDEDEALEEDEEAEEEGEGEEDDEDEAEAEADVEVEADVDVEAEVDEDLDVDVQLN